MIPYVLHVSLLVGVCFILFKLLLEKFTFFRLNRYLLLIGICLCLLLPIFHIPPNWQIKLWNSEPEAHNLSTSIEESIFQLEASIVELNESTLAEKEIQKSEYDGGGQDSSLIPGFIGLIWLVYYLGLIGFGLRWLFHLYGIMLTIRKSEINHVKGNKIIYLPKDMAPFSFWNIIFVNPKLYDEKTYAQILSHESIHIQQKHSLDLMLAELLIVFQWFNPFAYLLRNSLEDNLEFLTDQGVLDMGQESQSYQLSLLSVSLPQKKMGLVSNYSSSMLKKRISMMNRPRSKVRSSWKYVLVFSFLISSIFFLNASKNSQEFQFENSSNSLLFDSPEQEGWKLFSDTNDSLQKIARGYGQKMGESLEGGSLEMRSEYSKIEAIDPQEIYLGEDKLEIKPSAIALENPSLQSPKLREMAGVKSLSKQISEGNYRSSVNSELDLNLLRRFKAFRSISPEDQTYRRILDSGITNEFLLTLQQGGFLEFEKEEFLLAIDHGLSQSYLNNISQLRRGSFSFREVSQLYLNGVQLSFIKSFQSLGFEDYSIQELILSHHYGISKRYLKEIENAGFLNPSLGELLSLKKWNIPISQIKNLTKKGHNIQELISKGKLKHSGRTKRIIEENRNLSGFSQINVHGKIRVVMGVGEEDRVIVKAFEDKIKLIETKVINGVLKIRVKPGYKSAHIYDVYVTARSLPQGQIITGGADYVSDHILRLE